jgi:uncharacterized protein YceH (UPF0502 family)
VDLSAPEIRVLGCLLEKQRTTPEAYPLSLNALRLACNQSTNRDPVVDYDEPTIRDALHRLSRRRWARLASGPGSRAPKYRHLLDEALALPDDELAVLCVLMLRGAQTPGELKQRTERLHPLADLDAVQATLERLIDRELAVRLRRRPGQKEERYMHLLGDDAGEPVGRPVAAVPAAAGAPDTAVPAAAGAPAAAVPAAGGGPDTAVPAAGGEPDTAVPAPVAGAPEPPRPPVDSAAPGPPAPDPRIARLEDEVATLRAEVADLRATLDALREELGA